MTGHKLIFVALCVFVLLSFSVFKLHFFCFKPLITEFLQV